MLLDKLKGQLPAKSQTGDTNVMQYCIKNESSAVAVV